MAWNVMQVEVISADRLIKPTIGAGGLTHEHPDGEDPRKAALEWLEDFAATMRSAGLRGIQVAKLP